jgi:hypothetical protein
VYAAPIVTLTAFDPICLQDGAITLSGGLPAGGEYTGTDVSAGTFTPTSAGSATVTYSYTDLNQCSSAATQSILVNDCASIEENNLLNVTVSPNPASDVIVISTDAQDAHFTVFTEEGKTVLTTRAIKNGSATINVSQLASGIYFIKINAHSGTETHKVIKQ